MEGGCSRPFITPHPSGLRILDKKNWLILGYTFYTALRLLSRPHHGRARRPRVESDRLLSIENVMAVLGGMIVAGILFDWAMQPYVIEHVNAQEPATTTPVEVEIIVRIDWTPARIERHIREVFHDQPDLAYAIAMAEGGMNVEVQSTYVKNGVSEPSYCAFQIHAPTWDKEAKALGYGDYKTNPDSCIRMARHIYDQKGNWTDWSAFNNGSYKKYMPVI